jgi:tRNA (guanine-N7-)-methyltransferase
MSQTFELNPEHKKKAIRSYVIRGGRITEAQKKAFNDVWPIYGLSLFDGPIDPVLAFGRQAPIVLEVGFGMGGSLIQMAMDQPETDFIGIEVHPPGVVRLVQTAAEEGLTNIRVYMADAMDVLEDCIADDSLSRFQLYFPDPWHKKKHNKRRIVQQPLMQLIHKKLLIKGVCHFATDWQPYADHMQEVMSLADGFDNCEDEYFFAPQPEYRPLTKFESRGQQLGHGVWDLLFKKAELVSS